MTMLLLPLIMVTISGVLSLDIEEMAATDACEGLALEELPTAYETNMMMNIKFGDINGQSRSIYEAVDGDKMKSFIHVATGEDLQLTVLLDTYNIFLQRFRGNKMGRIRCQF